MYTLKIDYLDQLMEASAEAFMLYKTTSLQKRKRLLYAIAEEIELLGDELIAICMKETKLSESRLKNERNRTCFQLRSYGDECERGNWLQVKIDTEKESSGASIPSLRKLMVPLGPVVIFGAGNFPLAFSTAGSDTAAALATGCTVVVKAHPGHPDTSTAVALAIERAIAQLDLPPGVFIHINDTSILASEMLVHHEQIKAVGFTGSLAGGRAIVDLAASREHPIPVFAEMSSINPVFIMPEKLHLEATQLGRILAASVILGAGQFCTKPGVIIGLEGAPLDEFIDTFSETIKTTSPVNMLNQQIADNFRRMRRKIVEQKGVYCKQVSNGRSEDDQDMPTLSVTTAKVFLNNPILQKEVFGSFTLIISCTDHSEMESIAECLKGQLTATLMATEKDVTSHIALVEKLKNICGRLILNNVPTGVEVCSAMQHGGPWPASSNSHFTSVGNDSLQRFVRPLCFQNWPDALLPEALQNENPLGIWRTINNKLSKKAIQ